MLLSLIPWALLLGAIHAPEPVAQQSLPIVDGAWIDLVGGRATDATSGHIRFSRGRGGRAMLRPSQGARLSLSDGWLVPDGSDPSLLPGKPLQLKSGDRVVFSLSGGETGRLRIMRRQALGGGEAWTLETFLVESAPEIVPFAPPWIPTVKIRKGGGGLRVWPEGDALLFSVATALLAEDPATKEVEAELVIELERGLDTGDWDELVVLTSVSPKASLPEVFGGPDQSCVVRLQARLRMKGGKASPPGPSFEVVSDAIDVEAMIDQLESPDFSQRLEARTALVARGERARKTLERHVPANGTLDSSPVRDVLAAIDRASGRVGPDPGLLKKRAREVLRPELPLCSMPSGLANPDPNERAIALLRMVDRAERGVAPEASGDASNESIDFATGTVLEDCERSIAWASAMAFHDPDPGVAAMAGFLQELGARPSQGSFDAAAPGWLLTPEQRRSEGSLDRAFLDLPLHADELAWDLDGLAELSDRRIGFGFARILAALREGSTLPLEGSAESDGGDSDPGPADSGPYDYDVTGVELALRLLERARHTDDPSPFLECVEALFPGPSRTLHAWREVGDRRMASPSSDAAERTVLRLEQADLASLEAALVRAFGLRNSVGVDIVLPAGDYRRPGAQAGTYLQIERSNVRLLGETSARGERPQLHVGIRVEGATNVVLENLDIEGLKGPALMLLENTHVAVVRTRIAGASKVIYVHHAELEVIESAIELADGERAQAVSVQLLGAARLFARGSIFRSGTIFLTSPASEAWLDRCVVDSGDRPIVQAQGGVIRGGVLMARESILKSEGTGLMGVDSGLLVATVIEAGMWPVGRRPIGLLASPRLFRVVGGTDSIEGLGRLPTEPLAPGH